MIRPDGISLAGALRGGAQAADRAVLSEWVQGFDGQSIPGRIAEQYAEKQQHVARLGSWCRATTPAEPASEKWQPPSSAVEEPEFMV